MPGLILAAVTPDNTPHGYNWTFAFPMLLFIVVALVLYLLFARPHRRVPGRPIAAVAAGRQPGSAAASAAAVASASATGPAVASGTASEAPASDSTTGERPASESTATESTASDSTGASE